MSLKVFQTRIGLGTALKLWEDKDEEEDIMQTA